MVARPAGPRPDVAAGAPGARPWRRSRTPLSRRFQGVRWASRTQRVSGPADGLPDLPPEWGRVVVPDDAVRAGRRGRPRSAVSCAGPSALRRRVTGRWRAATAGPAGGGASPPLAGLLAVTWPRANRGTDRPTPARLLATGDPDRPGAARPGPGRRGRAPVPLRGLLPAMIILLDGCPCPDRVDRRRGSRARRRLRGHRHRTADRRPGRPPAAGARPGRPGRQAAVVPGPTGPPRRRDRPAGRPRRHW